MYDGNPGDDNKMSRDELKGILASERNGMTLKDITDQTSKMPVIRL